jgi:putative transposase
MIPREWRRPSPSPGGGGSTASLEHDVFYRNRDSLGGRFLIQTPCWERRPAWMTRPYSEDLRERALARADAGETVRSIAEALEISPSCVTKWKNLRRETGGVSPGKIGGHKKPVLSGANADWLRKRVVSGPFTLRKLTQELAARGIKTDVRAVWTFVHAEGLSFKKNDPAGRTRSPRYRP